DSANLQALCWLCNTNKGAGDATDFGRVRDAYEVRDAACLFCSVSTEAIVASNSLAFAIRDRFPVTSLHTLVISRRHVSDYFELHDSEVRAMHRLLHEVREGVLQNDKSVLAFNVGANAGTVAGQTVPHCHIHLIPRRQGDLQNPRGGVRAVIPGKADYKE